MNQSNHLHAKPNPNHLNHSMAYFSSPPQQPLSHQEVAIGIHCVTPCQPKFSGDLLAKIHQFRHQIFIKQQQYDVYDTDNLEFDAYDRPNTVHFVKMHQGQILALFRINPTHLPYMLDTLWPHTVDEPHQLPHSPSIWEGSRLTIAKPWLNPTLDQRIRIELGLAFLEFAGQQGITGFIGLSYPTIWQQLMAFGWPVQLLGKAHALAGGYLVQAGMSDINLNLYQRMQQRTHILRPVILN